jgi:hypothetical protein
MSASNDFEADILKLIFNNTTIANIGDATGLVGSTGVGSVFIALHTADPGEAGNQSTSEATYTGYARVAVARGSGTLTVTGTAPTQVANVAAVTFGLCTVGSNTITHFSIGYQTSGATKIIVSGALNASLAVSVGITPSFAASALVATCD